MSAQSELRTCLYNEAQLNAVLDRMASQAAALPHGEQAVAVIGILRRGVPLADSLTERLVRLHQLQAPMRLDLQVKRYSDDL